jgi:2-oxo-3-hexenedioate decarboxylase
VNEQWNGPGGHVVGLSLGSSSRDEQRVDATAPTIGWLTDAMVLPAGLPVPTGHLTDPRVTPGLVFLLGKELTGPGATAPTALAAVDRVYAGVEIIDSRCQDLRSATPNAATDNASLVRFVIGPVSRRPEDLDLSLEACLLEVDGRVFDSATGAAAHGHPAEALALAANALAEQKITLQPGWLVFTGGLTGAVSVTPETTVTASFTHLGSITLAGS